MDNKYTGKLIGIVVISAIMLSFSLAVSTFDQDEHREQWMEHHKQLKESKRSTK